MLFTNTSIVIDKNSMKHLQSLHKLSGLLAKTVEFRVRSHSEAHVEFKELSKYFPKLVSKFVSTKFNVSVEFENSTTIDADFSGHLSTLS
mmetsp:Transcript_3100/g.3801  ORF Transcript_3100/g.3801 Transcript_3100/m.3801 type:complete len:90 (+) Transcript_3100:264-533(+)